MSGIARKVMSVLKGPEGAWDLSFAYYDPEEAAWDISAYAGAASATVNNEEISPTGLFFKPDGTKMYIVGYSGDDVNEYDLSTAWDVSSISFLQRFPVSSQETVPTTVFFKPDGTKMYVSGRVGRDVNEYDLSTAWDVSSASFLQNFSVSSQDTDPRALFFKPDGTKMYVLGDTGNDVNEYNLSTAWDVSSASYLQNFSVVSEDATPRGLFFKPDGTRMYITGQDGNNLYEYDLSTPWDVSSASFLQSNSINAGGVTPEAVFFKPDGLTFYILQRDNVSPFTLSRVLQRNLGAFTTNTATAGEEVFPRGISFKPDGTKMYITGGSRDMVTEYDLSTPWNIFSASPLQDFSVADNSTAGLFFKPDGTAFYYIRSSSSFQFVNKYTMSSAWDVSTAAFSQSLRTDAQDSGSVGLSFKPDGTKMYVSGVEFNSVYEYDLSTAWDLSSASFLQSFDLSGEVTGVGVRGLFFKPDGTKMYVMSYSANAVYAYDLGTDWDISSAFYVQDFVMGSEVSTPNQLFFRGDGTQMFLFGQTGGELLSYTLGPQ